MFFVMTALRLISMPVHAALEMFVGLALMAAPFVLGFTPAGTVLGLLIGTLFVGLALAASAPDGAGRHPLSIASHHAFDYGLATGLLGAAVVVGIAGDRVAAVFFAAVSLTQLALNLSTRYSARG
jgi:hypothetical protein